MTRLEKTRNLILCALFAALTAVLSQIAIPIQPVPINLATFSVFVAGGVLGAKRGAISQAVYVLLGAVGLPCFPPLAEEWGSCLGPTGGYIVGYVAAAWLVGLLSARCHGKAYWFALSMAGGVGALLSIGHRLVYGGRAYRPGGIPVAVCRSFPSGRCGQDCRGRPAGTRTAQDAVQSRDGGFGMNGKAIRLRPHHGSASGTLRERL